jgi:hypothetical protein
MKVKYNLNPFDIDTNHKKVVDNNGNQLSTSTLESILAVITNKYQYNGHQSVQIHHKCFSNITSDYRKHLDYLVGKGIILINEQYKNGEYSKSYLFKDSFKENANVISLKAEKSDKKMDTDNSIEIDQVVLDRLRQDILDVNILNYPVEKEILFFHEEQPIVNFKGYLSNEFGLHQLRNGDRNIHIKRGRLYSPFIQLSKKVRSDYFYFDTKLRSLDIKRSFPLWLSIWLVESGIPLDYETKSFFSSVLTGNIYGELMEKYNCNKNLFNRTESDRKYIDRDETKRLFSQWLNGNPERKTLPNLVMKAYYPKIFDFVKHFKNGCKERMYDTLAVKESNFIFNTVCKKLYQKIPEIQLLTCHDEIYFEERFYPLVVKIWNKELNRVIKKIPVKADVEFRFKVRDFELIGIYIEYSE